MKYIVIILIFTSCVQKFSSKDLLPQHLPKEVPEMVLVEYKDNSKRQTDTSSIGLFNSQAPRVLVSKHEITNKQFCYFLNVDSIRTNSNLLKSIIDLSHPDNRIEFKKDKYVSATGYEDYPVVLVSWWGAKKYGAWLTEYVNKQREEKGFYRLPTYRLPTEFEWMVVSNPDGSYKYPVEVQCDSVGLSPELVMVRSHNIKSDRLNAAGVAGMDVNVYEWTDDDYDKMQYIMDFSMSVTYYDDFSDNAVVRKHGYIRENNCGRLSRVRAGFYSDTGFRIVQTFMGRATGGEF